MTEQLKEAAYVIVEEAACFYEPSLSSAVRIIPPYGSEVSIIEEQDGWVLLRWCGKDAWSVREHLGNELTGPKENVIPPSMLYKAGGYSGISSVEYGPRGGRYTRTKSGFRRYF